MATNGDGKIDSKEVSNRDSKEVEKGSPTKTTNKKAVNPSPIAEGVQNVEKISKQERKMTKVKEETLQNNIKKKQTRFVNIYSLQN